MYLIWRKGLSDSWQGERGGLAMTHAGWSAASIQGRISGLCLPGLRMDCRYWLKVCFLGRCA